ncbi:hypothetical protein P7L53_00335 [Thermoleptolyngbya sichuanensis XZ-Cy5]|uniref:hypothetical protein n=1 Tax=Thermoleptolyngbya sichuanensis TaxID=2885951 RepID=UPI00240E7A7E|nr:hypothetical protein [Thermoleptolyngbya sichuanensis]MDG2614679.1 hypothetical protein [Thermoleptolyngbya sichuanensis XZ-Cy5]
MVQQYFSEEEWAALTQAPMQAIIALTLADKADPVSFMKEVQAGVKILAVEQQRQDLPPDGLVSSVVSALNEVDLADSTPADSLLLKKEFQILRYIRDLQNASEGRNAAIAHFDKVKSVLATKVTGVQANEYRDWLLAIATKVAEAVKEGGFLGIGGEKISQAEASVLRKLEDALTP